MKRGILILCLAFVFYFMFVSSRTPTASLRLRVIADSDSDEAQEIKGDVVQALEEIFEEENFVSVKDAENWIEENMQILQNTCRRILEGKDTDFDIEIRDEHYEEGYAYGVRWPAGEYRSLVVTLGKGGGHNFWGTLFPNIAFGASGASGEGKSLFVIKKGANLIEARSFVYDKIKKFFKK